MFGYMTADLQTMTEAQKLRYRGCYCGLCRSIGRRCGQMSRCALTYDMVFLALLLHSLYEPAERGEARPCPVHPLRRRESWASEATAYAADMNVLLAYENCLDDWRDERKLLRGAEAKLLERPAAEAAGRNPRQAAAIHAALENLREIELRGEPSPDPGANAFGGLMAELFVWREDRWAPLLRETGAAMGRFIYLLDAALDREKDRKRGCYNPVRRLTDDGMADEELRSILRALAADCAEVWERLPLVLDADIQRNILYGGAWSRLPLMEGKSP